MKPKIKVSEAQILSAIVEYLSILEKQGKIMFLRVDSGARPIAYETKDGWKKHFIRYGKKGWPDILVWKGRRLGLPADREIRYLETYFLEVKRPDAKLSPDQLAFQEQVEAMGGSYHIVRDVQEVEKILSL